ncbi:hypothetical protein JQ612_27460 [Bradyrhizobium manausense]|uniref:hypothetical protein n=1 Tax=Bradyrhizobium manausense TaxID=989370 RepID=UPI001BA80705|nr:hypothetical protein [Bradyrhizobium manausense]MBR0836949.1 hypothetical protein [Bradyrhizobium manausense]
MIDAAAAARRPLRMGASDLGAEAAAKYSGRKKEALSREKIDVDGNYPVASDPY